jgi:hypothetical protein
MWMSPVHAAGGDVADDEEVAKMARKREGVEWLGK